MQFPQTMYFSVIKGRHLMHALIRQSAVKVKTMTSKQKIVHGKILSGYLENPGISLNLLAKKLDLPRSTVQRVIKKFKEEKSIERTPGSGRNPGTSNPEVAQKVLKAFQLNPKLSVRDVADKAGTSKSTVDRIKKREGLRSYHVQKTPDRTAEKQRDAKARSRKLYERYLTKFSCVVMDDETYIKADFSQLPGQEFYVAMARGEVDEKFKNRKCSKFPKNFLVWQAICSCGRKSKPFISTGTINQEIYTVECLKKRLLPFIRSHNEPVLFWPDLATCHYGKRALSFYEDMGINVVPRDANPPNCPELRPIEKYWANIKSKLKKTKQHAVNIADFKRKYAAAARTINEGRVQTLMARLRFKVKNFYSSSAN